jgi:hypothetical protein
MSITFAAAIQNPENTQSNNKTTAEFIASNSSDFSNPNSPPQTTQTNKLREKVTVFCRN